MIKFWGMGSIILASSGMQQIKERYPTARIMFLTLHRNREVVEALSICDEALYLDIDCGILPLVRNILRLLRRLRNIGIDLVIDLEFFTRFSALMSYLLSARASGGFHHGDVWRGELHTIEVPFNNYWHTKRNFENLISRCICREIEDRPVVRPRVTPVEAEKLQQLLASKGISSHEPLICLNPNAGELALKRRWPAGSFVELGKNLAKLYPGYRSVYIGSKSEQSYVRGICSAIAEENAINLAGQMTFGMLVALLARACLLITNDSGPLHLAVAVGTPTISFFGPETPVLYGPPQNGKHMILYKNLDCSPCINVYNGKLMRCVRDTSRCLAGITPAETLKCVSALLDSRAASQATGVVAAAQLAGLLNEAGAPDGRSQDGLPFSAFGTLSGES